jgi:hypothetical protein
MPSLYWFEATGLNSNHGQILSLKFGSFKWRGTNLSSMGLLVLVACVHYHQSLVVYSEVGVRLDMHAKFKLQLFPTTHQYC